MTTNDRATGSAVDDRALALMESAVQAIGRGEPREAARALKQAAELHAFAGRQYDEARCLQLAATLSRFAGATQTRALLDDATAAGPSTGMLAISIEAERGESAFADRRFHESVTSWTSALAGAEAAALGAAGVSTLLRRRAAALVALGQLESADADVVRATALTEQALGVETSHFVAIEHVDRLWRAGFTAAARSTLDSVAGRRRGQPRSAHLDAEIGVWLARFARADGDTAGAVDHARQARSAALEAIAVTSYFAASVELAESHRVRGEHGDAYGALATAWASLSDVIGGETAQSWVEPCLAAYSIAWGADGFAEARSAYESVLRS